MFQVLKERVNHYYFIVHISYPVPWYEEVMFKGPREECDKYVSDMLESRYKSRGLGISSTF